MGAVSRPGWDVVSRLVPPSEEYGSGWPRYSVGGPAQGHTAAAVPKGATSSEADPYLCEVVTGVVLHRCGRAPPDENSSVRLGQDGTEVPDSNGTPLS
jgi:hypothetical protein